MPGSVARANTLVDVVDVVDVVFELLVEHHVISRIILAGSPSITIRRHNVRRPFALRTRVAVARSTPTARQGRGLIRQAAPRDDDR